MYGLCLAEPHCAVDGQSATVQTQQQRRLALHVVLKHYHDDAQAFVVAFLLKFVVSVLAASPITVCDRKKLTHTRIALALCAAQSNSNTCSISHPVSCSDVALGSFLEKMTVVFMYVLFPVANHFASQNKDFHFNLNLDLV